MSQLIYRYGAMNSGKSLQLLSVNHNYTSQGKKTLIFKPILDTRSNSNLIESRIGISAECLDINTEFNIYKYITEYLLLSDKLHCILCDESQFLTKEQVKQLSKIVDEYDIPCLCYGLKNSYKENELFEGSQALLYFAEKIEEIKQVCMCKDCTKKATHNLKLVNGKPVYDGNIVSIGDIVGEERYLSVCRNHYYNPEI